MRTNKIEEFRQARDNANIYRMRNEWWKLFKGCSQAVVPSLFCKNTKILMLMPALTKMHD